VKAESVRERHDVNMSRLTGDLSKVERKNDAIQKFSKSSIKLKEQNIVNQNLTSKHTLVSSDKRNTQSTLDDYLPFGDAQSVSDSTESNKITTKLDTAEP
jgi:uncharacterized lipoprotein YajG